MKKVMLMSIVALSLQTATAFAVVGKIASNGSVETGKADCRAMTDLKRGILGASNPPVVYKAAQNPSTKTATGNAIKGRF